MNNRIQCQETTLIFSRKSAKTDAEYWGECIYFPEAEPNTDDLIGIMCIWKKGQNKNNEKPILTRTYMTRFPGTYPTEPDLRSLLPHTSWENCFRSEIENIDGSSN